MGINFITTPGENIHDVLFGDRWYVGAVTSTSKKVFCSSAKQDKVQKLLIIRLQI
jgi:hypothetical protein